MNKDKICQKHFGFNYYQEIFLESINKRLTETQDKYLEDKAENNRLKRLKKREIDYIYELIQDEFKVWDMIEKLGHDGPYSLQELFKYTYFYEIEKLVPSKVSLFSKIQKDDNWKGGTMVLPKVEE